MVKYSIYFSFRLQGNIPFKPCTNLMRFLFSQKRNKETFPTKDAKMFYNILLWNIPR